MRKEDQKAERSTVMQTAVPFSASCSLILQLAKQHGNVTNSQPELSAIPLHAAPPQCPRSCGGLNHIFIYHQPSSSFVTTPPAAEKLLWSRKLELYLSPDAPFSSVYACAFVIRGNIFHERGKLSFIS